MARARNIKPGFFTNEELVDLPFSTRLLFIGLWTIADRAGRLEDRPKRIKIAIFPADSIDVDAALNELQASGFLLRYEHGGGRYIQILAFAKHQNPHKDEKQSMIPAPCEHGASTVQAPCSHGGNLADSPILRFSDSPNPSSPIPSSKPTARGEDYTEDFEEAWAIYPKRPGASKKESFKAWNARLKAGVDASALLAGVRCYANFVKETKPDPQYIKQPATFFGPDEHYLANWAATPKARASPTYETAKDKSRRETSEQLTGRNRNEERCEFIDIN